MLQKLLLALSQDLNGADVSGFSKKLGALIRLIGISAIAESAGVNRLTLHHFMQGSKDIYLSTLCSILSALDIEIILKAKPQLKRDMKMLAYRHKQIEESSQPQVKAIVKKERNG